MIASPAGTVGPLRRRRPHARLFAAWILLVGGLSATARAASLEYRVKAAFLYNFTKFVEWPSSAFPTAQTPFSVCVLGPDPFGAELDAIARQGSVQGRKIVVRRAQELAQLRDCHILFMGAAAAAKAPTVLGALAGSPTLTVGETEDFTRVGGGVRFFLFENKVRFEINRTATSRAHLKVSSKLFGVARVLEEPAPGE